jgi:hypothetical protein
MSFHRIHLIRLGALFVCIPDKSGVVLETILSLFSQIVLSDS